MAAPALILEDGSVVADANAYADRVFADVYFANRLESRWIGNVETKDAALIRATSWIEKRYGSKWRGTRTDSTQELSWPRQDVYIDGIEHASDAMPKQLQEATCEYALRALERVDIAPDPPLQDGKGAPVEKSINLGRSAIVITNKFANPGESPGSETIPDMPEAEMLLGHLVLGGTGAGGISFGIAGRA